MERIKFKWNIPNVLSLVRLALIPLFAWLYLDDEGNLYWAMLVLLLSGLTDVVDGFVARRFNQITEIGKLLDPLADKVTQLAVLVCLSVRYRQLIPLMVICLAKEVLQIVGGVLLLSRYEIVRGSRWFGKISTITFYGAMLAIVLWNNMPQPVFTVLVVLVTVTMLFSFFAYMRVYLKLRREAIEREN
ncbi:MAG: CDP-alcohol phosphatidyltransferase family protein [Clostridia bacterium]|nr:CDP-alcohol phosphatidyltransferase family protein [Clostridia bacterium]